nr:MAG TPA: hypothetical protein [Caudoviricetes sp.]DAY38650.1 MAG TPA: hypothetical protein [Caudoviricetes sp.]
MVGRTFPTSQIPFRVRVRPIFFYFISSIILYQNFTKKAPFGAFPSECGVLNIHLIALITVQMFKQCTYTCNSILYHVQTFGK